MLIQDLLTSCRPTLISKVPQERFLHERCVFRCSYFGFIDKDGKIAIPFLYSSPNEYVFMEEDGAQVTDPKTGEVFFISPEGREFRKK